MNTFRYFSDANMAGALWPVVVTGLAVAMLCALLSVLVVLKRLAFIGQGISHAGFGGMGLAAVMGLAAAAAAGSPSASVGQFLVVLAFCLLSALLIGFLNERGQAESDTAIGIVLVGTMAIGIVLMRAARSRVNVESFLFGDLLAVNWTDAAIGWSVTAAILLALWAARRPLLFWSFDPTVARALGVSDRRMNLLLMFLLGLATVTAMRLAGAVLATAMLVLPGAIALRLSRRWAAVLWLAAAAALVGILGGLLVSLELSWPPGAAIVTVLCALFALACAPALTRRAA
ncbi:MAG TPA: metal ABC transporter permease [Phycisphaerales bacterium]|nr:metal ABC transporter permease [Phycisphaerales bacterium]